MTTCECGYYDDFESLCESCWLERQAVRESSDQYPYARQNDDQGA